MFKILFSLFLLTFSSLLLAWDWGFKTNFQRTTTNNVNLANTEPVSDSYNTLGAYLQAKDDSLKFKLKIKVDKYKLQQENDNNTLDFSFQYKESRKAEYTLAVFKQTYTGIQEVDVVSSDNTGARISGTFSHQYNKNTNGYITLNGSSKKYSNYDNRIDKTIGAALGLEHYLSSTLMVYPDFSIENNISSQSLYNSLGYGPSISISLIPNEFWEFFINNSFTHTIYSGRDKVSYVIKGKTFEHNEYQELFSTDIGGVYAFAKIMAVQLKYSFGKNTSNASTSAYQANSLSFDFNVRI